MKRSRYLATVAVFCFAGCLFAQPDRSGFSGLIVVDTKGVGFHFTDPAKGDYFRSTSEEMGNSPKSAGRKPVQGTCGSS